MDWQGLTLRWWEYPLIVVLTIGTEYLLSFAREKAKNLATKSDIQKLMDQMHALTTAEEEARGQVSRFLNAEQRQWDERQRLYTLLLQHLGDAARLYSKAFELQFEAPYPDQEDQQKRRSDTLSRWYKAASEGVETVISHRPLVEMWLPKEAQEAFDKLEEGLAAADAMVDPFDDLDNTIASIRTAYHSILDCARHDIEQQRAKYGGKG